MELRFISLYCSNHRKYNFFFTFLDMAPFYIKILLDSIAFLTNCQKSFWETSLKFA